MFGDWIGKRWNPVGSLAIVTGASSGIGRELTGMLVKEGCRVIAVARREDRLKELVEAHGDAVVPIVGDVADQATIDAAFACVERQVSMPVDTPVSFDLLVNNAGIGGIGPFMEADDERMRQIMEVNFFAPCMWTRRAIPLIRANRDRHPVICNIGSVLGHTAVPDKSEYCASKFALHGFSDSLRMELASDGIAVTLVSPSTTRSEFFESLVGTEPGQVSKSVGSWPPERVSRQTLRAIKRRQRERILSLGGKTLVYADRVVPSILSRLLSR